MYDADEYWQGNSLARTRTRPFLLATLSLVWILLAGFVHFLTGPQYEFHLAPDSLLEFLKTL